MSQYLATPGTDRRIHVGQGGFPFWFEVAPSDNPMDLTDFDSSNSFAKFMSPSGTVRTKELSLVASGSGTTKTIDDDRGIARSYFAQLTCTVDGDEVDPEEFFDEAGTWVVWIHVKKTSEAKPHIGTATEFEVFAAGSP